MAPKKKGQKMDLNAFLADDATGSGSWADEMDALPSGPSMAPKEDGPGIGGSHLTRNMRGGPDGGFGGRGGFGDERPQRVEVPIPTAPPYTAFVGNLTFETSEQDVAAFFEGLGVKSIRLVSGQDGKPRGFGYVEFNAVDDLKNALTATGNDLAGRPVRISVAEAQQSRFGRADEASTWERTGPLPSLGGRDGGRGFGGGFGGASSRGGFGEEVERDAPLRGGKFTPSAPSEPRRSASGGMAGGVGFSGYERAGRIMAPEPEVERDGPIRGGKFVPSEPAAPAPRRMFSDREPSRADEGSWERRGPLAGGPPAGASERRAFGSGFGARTPSDPPTRRPLNLSARTPSASGSPSEASSGTTTPSAAGAASSKASPFGAARAVDTATKEREVEEKIAKARAEAAVANAQAPSPAPAAAKPAPAVQEKKEEQSRSEGAWVRRGPLPEKAKAPAAAKPKEVAPPVAAKDAPPHQQQQEKRKEGGFSFANAAAALDEIEQGDN
ncbi:hypothetical protein JCM6882_002166 [Rhodosporidiobolus microsporus]